MFVAYLSQTYHFLLICSIVHTAKISDKSVKFLTHYSNIYGFGFIGAPYRMRISVVWAYNILYTQLRPYCPRLAVDYVIVFCL